MYCLYAESFITVLCCIRKQIGNLSFKGRGGGGGRDAGEGG